MFWFFWLRGMWDLSCLTRDQTHNPSFGRQNLHHYTAREVSDVLLHKLLLGAGEREWTTVKSKSKNPLELGDR